MELRMDNLNCKGDYMSSVKEMDNRIKEIDSAIPSETSKYLREVGLDTSMLVTCYWNNGTCEIINIAAHWAILINNK